MKGLLMPLTIGAPVDDLVFLKPTGEEIALRQFLGKPLLLVFLRHLA